MDLITDAVCVKVIALDKLFIGTGNRLRYFYVNNGKKTAELPVPLGPLKDKIHGIDFWRISDHKFRVVVHAGREIVAFILDHDTFSFIQKCNFSEPQEMAMFGNNLAVISKNRSVDWISSILMYKSDSLAILTAHNVLLNMTITYDNAFTMQKVSCEDSSTLYCSKIVGNSWNSLLIFVGTALGELVVWSPKPKKILYRISGHNGVIFSIDFHPVSHLLTTTSDDRSVKFWKFQIHDDQNVTMKELKKSFGHTARVFRSKIIESSSKLIIATIGEDSHLCLWDDEGSFLMKKCLHGGAIIWGLDYEPISNTIFTSASNGEIRKICIKKYFEEIDENSSNEVENEINEKFSKIRLMDNGFLIGITEQNGLYFKDQHFELVESELPFRCSIIQVKGDRIFLAGNEKLAIYELFENKFHLILTKNIEFGSDEKVSIVRSIFFLAEIEAIVCDSNGKCLVFDSNFDVLKHTFVIPKCKERFLTSAGKYENFFVLADRCGHLFLFEMEIESPVYTLHRVHGILGITNIMFDENSKTEDGVFFKTTGHDGTVKTILLDTQSKTLQLYYTEKIPIVWIEKVLSLNNQEFFFGFNDNHFVCYERDAGILFEESCGGGHRYWDILLGQHGDLHFYYIQRNKIKHKTFELIEKCENLIEIPRLNWHTMICNVLKVQKLANDRFLMVSGGEDNALKLNVFDFNMNLVWKRTISSHISNVRAILLKDLDENKILIWSAGGRAQICVTVFYKAKYLTKDLSNFMLKMTDEERNSQEIDFDPETRFMCATLLDDQTLVVGCSDGYVRAFNIDDNFVISLKRENYYGKCILNIHSVKFNEIDMILTMATDGLVCLWEAKALMNFMPPFHRLAHHSSGINAFDIIVKQDDCFIVATGGDDQAICLSVVRISKIGQNVDINVNETVKYGKFHTAQVSGVRFLNKNTLLTTGIDQKVYQIKFKNIRNLLRNSEYLSSIADVKGIVNINKDKFLIYGNGFEVFNSFDK